MKKLTVNVTWPEGVVAEVPAHYVSGTVQALPTPDAMPGWRFRQTSSGEWIAFKVESND